MTTSTINNVNNFININMEENLMTKEEIHEHRADVLHAKTIIDESNVREWTWYDNWMPIGQISYSEHDNKHIHKVEHTVEGKGYIRIGLLATFIVVVLNITNYITM